MAVTHFVGLFLPTSTIPSASLHPRLYAFAALRGLSSNLHQLVQSFLRFVGPSAVSKTRLLDRVFNALVEKAVYVNLDLVRSFGPIGVLFQVAMHFVLERFGGVVDGLDLFVFRSG